MNPSDFDFIGWIVFLYPVACSAACVLVGHLLFKLFLWMLSGQREAKRLDESHTAQIFIDHELERRYFADAVQLQQQARQHPGHKQVRADVLAAQEAEQKVA